MPCSITHLLPTHREKELYRAANLLVYVRQQTKKTPEKWLLAAAQNKNGRDPRSIIRLCTALRLLSPDQIQTIVYNAHHKTARDLADWWEEHKAVDVAREERERRRHLAVKAQIWEAETSHIRRSKK